MENASKALLIAAAVLIVILLIAFGMQIFNSASSSGDQVQSTADSMAIQSFNAQFTSYEGTSVSAKNVRSLMALVKASNGANPEHQVKFTPKTLDTSVEIKDGKTYIVELSKFSNGYLTQIKLTENP